MIPARRVPLAGSSPRRASRRLGETEQAWYIRAKAAVAKFDRSMEGSKGVGVFAQEAKLRDFLADKVARVEGSSPAAYAIFDDKDLQDAVLALEDAVRTEEDKSLGAAALGQSAVSPVICAAAGLVVLGTIIYFAVKG